MPSLRTADGRTLSWREVGAGPPLLLHPGGPGCSGAHFGDLPELAAERTLILLDPRGTGESDRPADRSDYGLEAYAADIEAVREALGLEWLALLGHSHGGFVGMAWGGTYPDRVDRLVLANTTPRFTAAIRERAMERALSHRGEPYFDDAVAARQEQQAGNYSSDEELAALYRRAGPILAPRGADTAPVVQAFERSGMNSDAIRHFNAEIAGSMDLRPMLERIEAPTLVLTGELDPFDPAADEMAQELPNPTLARIPGADHFGYLEADSRPAWSRAVLDFLAG